MHDFVNVWMREYVCGQIKLEFNVKYFGVTFIFTFYMLCIFPYSHTITKDKTCKRKIVSYQYWRNMTLIWVHLPLFGPLNSRWPLWPLTLTPSPFPLWLHRWLTLTCIPLIRYSNLFSVIGNIDLSSTKCPKRKPDQRSQHWTCLSLFPTLSVNFA